MANAAVFINNLLTTEQSIDIKIDERKQIRAKLRPRGAAVSQGRGPSIDVGDITSLSELNAAPDMRKLLDAVPAKVSVTVAPGTSDIQGADVGAVVDPRGMMSAAPRLVVTVAAGSAGARDVSLYTANFPFPAQIIDQQIMVRTGVAGTVTLRDALAAGGNALSAANSTTTATRVRDPGTGQTAGNGIPPSIAAGSSLVLRMTAGDAALVYVIDFVRTA